MPDADFGPEADWRPGFEQFLAACRDEARLNPIGRMISHGQALKILTRTRAHPRPPCGAARIGQRGGSRRRW